MQSRLQRYEDFVDREYIAGLIKGDEYSLAEVRPEFRAAIAGGVRRVVFTGMGCSAIVSDLIRGYLLAAGVDLEVTVVNDYEFDTLIPAEQIQARDTIFVISSYSGHSSEPVLAFERLLEHRDRMLLLTSGGRLAELGRETQTSIALWQLSNPDREYPLFHVTQYFAILLNMLYELRLLPARALVDVNELAGALRRARPRSRLEGERLAASALDANVLMIAQPGWHDSMLKLAKMHLNEIAMVPAGRNYFHEFCHSEVATLSHPSRKHCVLIFADRNADAYTQEKQRRLLALLTAPMPQNANVQAHVLRMRGQTFVEKLFTTLDVVQFLTAALTRARETESRDLISEAAGNPWYHSMTITAELEESRA